ncbi:MAG: hypothetical protein ABW201_13065 [Candidatus Thiodiazotropha sp.]
MAITLAFDVYGILTNTHAVVSELNDLVQDKAEAFSHKWREKTVGILVSPRTHAKLRNLAKREIDSLDDYGTE